MVKKLINLQSFQNLENLFHKIKHRKNNIFKKNRFIFPRTSFKTIEVRVFVLWQKIPKKDTF